MKGLPSRRMLKYWHSKKKMANKKKKKTNKKNVAVIITCAVLALILIIVLCAYLILKSYIGKINHVGREEWDISYVDESTEPVTDENGETVDATVSSELNSQGADYVSGGQAREEDYVRNIVLIGSDNRHYENLLNCPGNSDAIILVSVNSKTKKIYLTSIMRDTAAYITYTDEMKSKYSNWKDGYDKINAANARGGPEFLLDTIESNFKIKVDDYVLVDFYSLIDIIDVLGGIPMTLTDVEAEAANNYIRDMEHDRYVQKHNGSDEGFTPMYLLEGGGNLVLNGVQAVGYARERQTSGSDYTRTERQRAVIEQIIIKCKTMSITKLNELANTLLPKVYTNMTENEILGMITDAITFLNYDVEQVRVPFDNMYYSTSAGNLMPNDYQETAEKLQSIIFATE